MSFRRTTIRHSIASMLSLAPLMAAAQAPAPAAPALEGVLSLTASATVEIPQDWMTLTLAAQREGSDANAVQTQLKQAVDAALAEARRAAKPGQVEVQTGSFSVHPRYGNKGQITGWQGRTELIVEGRDMTAIAQLSGRISSMTIARVAYGLSREAREKVESEVSAQAVARFRAKAAELARHFGYGNHAIREVSVSTDAAEAPSPYPKVAMMSRAESADVALPTEPGKGTVTATVNGSVQMKP
jgi:predicted secreted protein